MLKKENRMKQKFYRCSVCGQIVAIVKETGVPIICCGQPMKEIIAGTTEASQEKHIPVILINNGKVDVCVGSVEHPMTPEHYIEWISIQTNKGNQRKVLTPGEPAKASFFIDLNEQIEAVYAYCNLHSLWKNQ